MILITMIMITIMIRMMIIIAMRTITIIGLSGNDSDE